MFFLLISNYTTKLNDVNIKKSDICYIMAFFPTIKDESKIKRIATSFPIKFIRKNSDDIICVRDRNGILLWSETK